MKGRIASSILGLLWIWLAACGGEAPDELAGSPAAIRAVETETVGGNTTLRALPPDATFGKLPSATIEASGDRTVSLFYPKPGQPTDGQCWQGLTSDRRGNIYPVAGVHIVKLDRNANIIFGKNDRNFFVELIGNNWAVLDEEARMFFGTSGMFVRAAPFRPRAEAFDLIDGLTFGAAVAIGRGPLDGSILVTDYEASIVHRVTLDPLAIDVFAGGPRVQVPEAIASAPNGTVYVVNVGNALEPAGRSVIRIAPNGSVRVFARARDTAARRMLAVDERGIVYWSSARGIERFKPDGSRLKPLPAPPDQGEFQNPMGSTFDPQGNLYVVENFGCKRIYKYTVRD